MKTELNALTGLRAVAAFLVFVFHLDLRQPLYFLPWPLHNLVAHGALGVTVFFVLSGFLLTYSHLPDLADGRLPSRSYFGRFMRKRLARIYPAYLVGLLLFGGALVAAGGASWLPAGPTALADLLLLQTAFPAIAMDWYGNGSWSISVELFFYLGFPFLLALLRRVAAPAVLWVGLGVVVWVGTAGGLAYRFWPTHITYGLMYTHPLFRGSEFIAGMLGGLLVFRFGWRASEWVALGLVGLATAYIAWLGPLLAGFVVHDWLVVPAVVVLLAALTEAPRTKLLRGLAHPWLVYAGRLSYCFYIAQLPFFAVQDMRLEAHLPLTAWWSGAAILGGTTLVAVLLHHGIELPAHRWLLPKRSAPAEAPALP